MFLDISQARRLDMRVRAVGPGCAFCVVRAVLVRLLLSNHPRIVTQCNPEFQKQILRNAVSRELAAQPAHQDLRPLSLDQLRSATD